jgi:hypothetical protein
LIAILVVFAGGHGIVEQDLFCLERAWIALDHVPGKSERQN